MVNKNNKKFLYIMLVALLFMVLGLILIGVAKIHDSDEITGITTSVNGFDMLQDGHIGSWLSSKYIWDTFKEFNQLSALMTLRAGIAFAVILTPILAAVGIIGFLYYFMPIKNKANIENKQEQIVVNQE
ncbi:hypothetical protein LT335_00088 [Spiroplasma sp. JKS002669]|uniref:hypothetical protein n=1 Tax=Spiroplasma attinicola TaxID=2904537 RepID=UPI002022ED2B|nr:MULTISPECIES: hypothetical protein [unclassified Spiroplasma]MCL6428549.1 hypothetical protein [Spiroplasma sp. JKS002669]MCL8209882.1 hypothetical protein [Spiroplasma sp. JKS002670]MCL8210844.1 hypothetical protein [Spiroplasma sp. JKS002671]